MGRSASSIASGNQGSSPQERLKTRFQSNTGGLLNSKASSHGKNYCQLAKGAKDFD